MARHQTVSTFRPIDKFGTRLDSSVDRLVNVLGDKIDHAAEETRQCFALLTEDVRGDIRNLSDRVEAIDQKLEGYHQDHEVRIARLEHHAGL